MPKALQAKTARETDQKSVLCELSSSSLSNVCGRVLMSTKAKAFSKWAQAYKTKMDLKAVAYVHNSITNSKQFTLTFICRRARYLRLPTSAPRRTLTTQPAPPSYETPVRSLPPRTTLPAAPPPPEVPPTPSLPTIPRTTITSRFGLASLLSTRSRSPERPERPSTAPKALSSKSRPKLSSRASTSRDSSPTRAGSTFAFPTRRSEEMGMSVVRPVSEAGDSRPRSGLWQEIREVQRRSRSRAPTERSQS